MTFVTLLISTLFAHYTLFYLYGQSNVIVMAMKLIAVLLFTLFTVTLLSYTRQNTSEKRSSLPDVFYPEYYLITDYLSTAQYLP